MIKKYFEHYPFENINDWLESDAETFEADVINFRSQFNKRYEFKDNKTIYYYDHKENSFYDWKVEVYAD